LVNGKKHALHSSSQISIQHLNSYQNRDKNREMPKMKAAFTTVRESSLNTDMSQSLLPIKQSSDQSQDNNK